MTRDGTYVDLMQANGEEYINGLRGNVFTVGGHEYAFFFYEVHRVAWGVAAGLPSVLVWDRHRVAVDLGHETAREYLRAAHDLMTERSAVFHGGS